MPSKHYQHTSSGYVLTRAQIKTCIKHLDLQNYEQAIKNSTIRTVTKELLSQSFSDESRVFRDLRRTAVFASFPLPHLLTASAVKVLRRVLEDGSVPFNLQDDGIRLCYENGWLHSDLTRTSTSEDPKMICFLPTRLHMK